MKSRLSICVTLLLLAAEAGNAQIIRQCSFRIAASSNNQTFLIPGAPSLRPATSLAPAKRLHTVDAGVYAELFPSSHFSMILGAEYQVRGGGDGVEYFSYQWLQYVEKQRRIGYVSFPLLFKYRAGQNKVTPYVVSGPSLGYPITDSWGPNWENPWVLGATIGGGVELSGLMPTILMVDIRYSLDLTRTFQVAEDGVDIQSNAIDVGIGVGF